MLSKKKNGYACVVFAIAVALSCSAFGAGAAIAVLYPDVREPYSSIFKDVLGGIKREADGKVKSYALKKDESVANLQKWLRKQDPEAVILLGNRGKSIAETVQREYMTLTGAAILSDQNIDAGVVGISLAPAPDQLFKKLKQLAPKTKRVVVIYHPQTNGWLMDLAHSAASELNIELKPLAAKDVREAAGLYQRELDGLLAGEDALWLLQGDPTMDERSLLLTILNKAWSRHTVVFSSNPSHVKRGALFSLFPDNFNMGKSLALKARQMKGGDSRKPEPLNDLLIAVNVRTAEHLNLNIDRSQLRGFDLIFPNR